jgi:15-cis-phytoene synthase
LTANHSFHQDDNSLDNKLLFLDIFQKGSKTYFFSSKFFPPQIRFEVSVLYSFVRVADNFVDNIPQQKIEFYEFVNDYRVALAGATTNNLIITEFIRLLHRKDFNPAWVDAFLQAMEWDLVKTTYSDLDEVIKYMYGSAEVVGLMMARILGLPEESFKAAQMLGRSMQYINFIRDIKEDQELGRTYFPQDELINAGLTSLSEIEISNKPEEFSQFIRNQASRYIEWQKMAESGYPFIPTRYLIPIKTAAEMYLWTVKQIMHDPLIVFRKKVKPSKARILLKGASNLIANNF